jgi:hypothetical protein
MNLELYEDKHGWVHMKKDNSIYVLNPLGQWVIPEYVPLKELSYVTLDYLIKKWYRSDPTTNFEFETRYYSALMQLKKNEFYNELLKDDL